MLSKIRKTFLSHRMTSSEEEYRHTELIWNFVFMTSFFCIFYILISLLINFKAGVISQSITFVLFWGILFLFKWTKLKNSTLSFLYIFTVYQTVGVLPYYSGGIMGHSVILPWLITVPIIAAHLSTQKQGWIWFFIMLVTLIIYSFLPIELTPITYNMAFDGFFVVSVFSGLALILLVVNRTYKESEKKYVLKLKEANEKIKDKNEEIKIKNKKLKDSHTKILDSIYYAKGVQRSILPTRTKRHDVFESSFCFQKAKDVLSGDFYWLEEHNDQIYFAVVDCQEHGVAGAFKSIAVHNLLHNALHNGLKMPGEILDHLNDKLDYVYQNETNRTNKFIHIGLTKWDKENRSLYYASTKHPLIMFQGSDKHVLEVKKLPLGQSNRGELDIHKKYRTHELDANQPTTLYSFTDGFLKQIGGNRNTPYSKERFQKALNNVQGKKIKEQQSLLSQHFENWQKRKTLTDDVLVLGIHL